MDQPSFFYEETVVNDLLGQGMFEDILQFRLKGYGLDEVKPLQIYETFIDIFLQITDPFQYLIKKCPADNGGFLEFSAIRFCFFHLRRFIDWHLS